MHIKENYVSHDMASRYKSVVSVYLRLAIGIGFLSAVADRLGWWGAPGTPSVAWGNFHNFLSYTAKLNPWFSGGLIAPVGWTATVCEIFFGVTLLIGYQTRLAAVLSGALTLAFAIGMVSGIGIHAPLNYSVFVVSAGSFMLASVEKYPLSVDYWRETTRDSVVAGAAQEDQIAA